MARAVHVALVLILSVCLVDKALSRLPAVETGATRRQLLQAGERPGHEYAGAVSMQASHSAMEQMMVKGAQASHVKAATDISLKNAQTSTKFWPKGSKYSDGVKGVKPASLEEDDK